jgi:iron-sulfur cluster repair protein YtfE (RIC family)
MLNKSVFKTLEVLEKVNWFFNCGGKLILEPNMTEKIDQCSSWQEALQEAQKREWRNIKNEGSNSISSFLDQHHRVEYQTWNDKVDEINPLIENLFLVNPINSVSESLDLSAIKKIVRSDIFDLLIESAWSHLAEPVFFAPVTFWYIKGHFPCGWRGDFPNGKLLVF